MTLPNDPIVRCGYSFLSLPPDHPFTPACHRHDLKFLGNELHLNKLGRNEADKDLLSDMLAIARKKNSLMLKAQAYTLYGVARMFGKLFW